MKGFAALMTLLAFALLYLSHNGYQKYLQDISQGTYYAKDFASSVVNKVQGTATVSKAKAATVASPQEVKATTTLATTTPEIIITHLKTPKEVKAVYMSSWAAGAPSIRKKMVDLIDRTEINAIVIDVKDNTGVITWEGRSKDIVAFVDELHKKNIYVIARVAAFQDPSYVKAHPEEAVHDNTTGGIWHDHKGVPWVDTGSKHMWEYLAKISKDAYAKGFDEINLDYIRFPTDGVLSHMVFPVSGEKAKDKRSVVHAFYTYISDELHKNNIPLSGDLFGIVLVSKVDIPVLGQDLHDALSTFDYVAPMVYPSHFYKDTAGYANPAAHPGPIITFAMKAALAIADETASSTGQATSTMRAKLRPWYQDFNMGATYTKELVRAQIDAGGVLGVKSWMLWDSANTYTESALKSQ